MVYLRKYKDIIKQDGNYVEVERELTKDTALGIMLKKYVYNTPSFSIGDYISRYDSTLIQHPITNKYAIEMQDTSGLGEIFEVNIETREVLELDGWFEVVEVEGIPQI